MRKNNFSRGRYRASCTDASKNADTTILNCRGKANIPMFEKILNHFGMNYIVMHDLDSPKVKRKRKVDKKFNVDN